MRGWRLFALLRGLGFQKGLHCKVVYPDFMVEKATLVGKRCGRHSVTELKHQTNQTHVFKW